MNSKICDRRRVEPTASRMRRLSPPRMLAAADAPCAASRADAFRIASTVAHSRAPPPSRLVRRREAASHHAVTASGPSGRRRRARGARLALHGPAWREGARAWTHQKSQTLTYENREFSAQMNPTPVYRAGPGAARVNKPRAAGTNQFRTAWKRTVGRSHDKTGISPACNKRCALELPHHASWWCVSQRRAGP